ncbi:MAG TPA: hypothetical protein VGW98_09695 [Solirubrobacteraceae bacterium]|nr:hypothetical protein [Solirubrobacteraceae bacterium]
MSRTDRLLGYVLWRGGKWYLRRRLPRARTLALRGLAAAGALTAAVLLARRAIG